MPRAPKTKLDDNAGPAPDVQLTETVKTTLPEPETPVTKTVTAISNELPPLAELPEPSPEIFDKPQESAPAESGEEKHDPAIHETPPRKNARGGWARKRGGARKSGTASHAHQPHKAGADEPEMSAQEITDRIDATAAMAAGTLFLCGEMLVGQCMKPDSDERSGITTAFRDYFRATGTIEVPPWIGLLGAVGLYVGRRWTHPDFSAKRDEWTGKTKNAEVIANV